MRPVAVIALVLAGCSPTDPLPSPRPCLVFPAELEFPETEVGVTERRVLGARNDTGQVVLGIDLEPVDAPFAVDIPLKAALAAELVELKAFFTPLDGKAHVARTRIVGGEGCAPQVLELRGLGAGAFSAQPLVEFGPVPVGARATRTLLLSNSRRRALTVTITDLDRNPVFEVAREITIPAASSVTLEVGFTPLAPGPAETRLVATTSTGERAETEVTAMGGLPRAELLTPRVDVPYLSSVEVTPRSIRIANDGDGDLELRAVTVRGLGSPPDVLIELEQRFVSPGFVATQHFKLIPNFVGTRAWTISFFTSDPQRPRLDVPVSATTADLFGCWSNVATSVTSITATAPYPARTPLRFVNPGVTPCLVDDLHFEQSGRAWSTDAPAQFFLPPQGEVTWSVDVSGPAAPARLEFRLIGAGTRSLPLAAQ